MPDEVTAGIRPVMARIGQELERAIEAGAPVFKDRMRPAAHHRVSNDGLGVVAGYSKGHAGFKKFWKKGGFVSQFQEFGTKNHRAQPFIAPAFRALLPHMLDAIDRAVTEALRRGSNYGR